MQAHIKSIYQTFQECTYIDKVCVFVFVQQKFRAFWPKGGTSACASRRLALHACTFYVMTIKTFSFIILTFRRICILDLTSLLYLMSCSCSCCRPSYLITWTARTRKRTYSRGEIEQAHIMLINYDTEIIKYYPEMEKLTK